MVTILFFVRFLSGMRLSSVFCFPIPNPIPKQLVYCFQLIVIVSKLYAESIEKHNIQYTSQSLVMEIAVHTAEYALKNHMVKQYWIELHM